MHENLIEQRQCHPVTMDLVCTMSASYTATTIWVASKLRVLGKALAAGGTWPLACDVHFSASWLQRCASAEARSTQSAKAFSFGGRSCLGVGQEQSSAEEQHAAGRQHLRCAEPWRGTCRHTGKVQPAFLLGIHHKAACRATC